MLLVMVDKPIYPDFKLITEGDIQVFDSFSRFTDYSDFNLLSLLSWNVNKTNAYSLLNGNLVLKIKEYIGEGYNYSVIGDREVFATIEQLINDLAVLKFVPDIVINGHKIEGAYKLTEDRDNFDYILSTAKVAGLAGNEMKTVRHSVKTFEKENPLHELKVLDHTNVKVQEAILKLTELWVTQKKYDNEKLDEESAITKNFLKYAKNFKCNLLGLYVKNDLIAYTFNEITKTNMVMGHFGKSLNGYTCAAHFTEYMTAKYYYGHGIEFINQEQDAGLEGLRAYKLSFKPVRFLKKYTVSKD